MNHAPAILAAPAAYCIHSRIIDQARNRQTVQNVSEKHAPSPLAATAGKGYFAECVLRNAESCQGVICGKFDADFFLRNEG